MSKGIMPEQLQTLLDTYEENRESEAWKTSRVFEQACECILYLIDSVEKRDTKIKWMEATIQLQNNEVSDGR
jgi:hypothetical protein